MAKAAKAKAVVKEEIHSEEEQKLVQQTWKAFNVAEKHSNEVGITFGKACYKLREKYAIKSRSRRDKGGEGFRQEGRNLECGGFERDCSKSSPSE